MDNQRHLQRHLPGSRCFSAGPASARLKIAKGVRQRQAGVFKLCANADFSGNCGQPPDMAAEITVRLFRTAIASVLNRFRNRQIAKRIGSRLPIH
jgi:hypothetical protein